MTRAEAAAVFAKFRQQRPLYQTMLDCQTAMAGACERLAPLTDDPDTYRGQAEMHRQYAAEYRGILQTIDETLKFADGLN